MSSNEISVSFPWKPAVFCDKCRRALILDEKDGVRILRHDASACERAGQVFLLPELTLFRAE
jgi:hypothetical protein